MLIHSGAYFVPYGWISGDLGRLLEKEGRALRIAGGWAYATRVRILFRDDALHLDLTVDCVEDWLLSLEGGGESVSRDRWRALTTQRRPLTGFDWLKPVIMGILNVTPDSFSDGGDFFDPQAALNHAHAMREMGADIIDIGGESSRPGAVPVSIEEEVSRVAQPIGAISPHALVSIDTRHGETARVAVNNGAAWINDIMAGRESEMIPIMAECATPVVLMHCLGQPKVMQVNPSYDNALLDIFDFLENRINVAVAGGVNRNNIVVDPGIGFGKSLDHNLTLIKNVSIFHGLGCPILFGASRKRIIDMICQEMTPKKRVPGSLFLVAEAIKQGCQIVRVHDVAETHQVVQMYNFFNG